MSFKGGAGKLNRIIVILKKTNTTSSFGAAREEWVPDTTFGEGGSIRAAYVPKDGFEYPKLGNRELLAEKRQSQDNAKFRIRYRPGQRVNEEANRIRYDGHDWNIISVIDFPDGRPIETHIAVTDIQ